MIKLILIQEKQQIIWKKDRVSLRFEEKKPRWVCGLTEISQSQFALGVVWERGQNTNSDKASVCILDWKEIDKILDWIEWLAIVFSSPSILRLLQKENLLKFSFIL